MKWLSLVLLTGCATAATLAASQRPAWVDAGVERTNKLVYVSGQSRAKSSEQEARDDALAAAVAEFVKYAGVEVEAFDRSVELYAQTGDKTLQSLDVEQRNTLRARAFVRHASPDKWWTHMEGRDHYASVRVKIPEEELLRVQKERETKLAIDVGLYKQGARELDLVSEGDVLVSGEAYGLFVTPSDGCYLYVFQTDAGGQTFKLFPNPQFKTANNPVAAGSKLWIPNGAQFLTLDQTTGKEKIYLFASLEKVPELEQATQLEEKKLAGVIKTMGVAGLVNKQTPGKTPPPKPDGSRVDDLKKKLQGNGSSFVYETWFWHR